MMPHYYTRSDRFRSRGVNHSHVEQRLHISMASLAGTGNGTWHWELGIWAGCHGLYRFAFCYCALEGAWEGGGVR